MIMMIYYMYIIDIDMIGVITAINEVRSFGCDISDDDESMMVTTDKVRIL